MGSSYCRFDCGAPSSEMGCVDYYDGDWEWPQGLAHYVEHHSVVLPNAFIATMRANAWKVPGRPVDPSSKQDKMRRVGYWLSKYERDLPDPRTLVRPGWIPDELTKVVAYLRKGRNSVTDLFERYEEFERMVGELNTLELLQKAFKYSCIPSDNFEYWKEWAKHQQSIHQQLSQRR